MASWKHISGLRSTKQVPDFNLKCPQPTIHKLVAKLPGVHKATATATERIPDGGGVNDTRLRPKKKRRAA